MNRPLLLVISLHCFLNFFKGSFLKFDLIRKFAHSIVMIAFALSFLFLQFINHLQIDMLVHIHTQFMVRLYL